MNRRTALGAIASAPLLAACGRSDSRSESDGVRLRMTEDPVTNVEPLGFPWKTADPFLFCVHHDDAYPAGNAKFGPVGSLAGRNIGRDFAGKDGWRMYHGDVVPGFPQHPHRGFETVTVVRRGLIDHSDSLGAAARYGNGDVQWLTAGSGIVHAEMFPLLDSTAPNPVELFQIWLNLPKVDKLADPHFQMFWSSAVPRQSVRDPAGRISTVTVVAGVYEDARPMAPPPRSWASRPDSDVAIWTVEMEPHAQLVLPPAARGTHRTLYYFRGAGLHVARRAIPSSRAVELKAQVATPLENGAERAEILVLQGRPIAEPVAQHGPFVMNTQEEIQQAFADYRRTRFGGWPWPENGPVHGGASQAPAADPSRLADRFARHADGRVERAT